MTSRPLQDVVEDEIKLKPKKTKRSKSSLRKSIELNFIKNTVDPQLREKSPTNVKERRKTILQRRRTLSVLATIRKGSVWNESVNFHIKDLDKLYGALKLFAYSNKQVVAVAKYANSLTLTRNFVELEEVRILLRQTAEKLAEDNQIFLDTFQKKTKYVIGYSRNKEIIKLLREVEEMTELTVIAIANLTFLTCNLKDSLLTTQTLASLCTSRDFLQRLTQFQFLHQFNETFTENLKLYYVNIDDSISDIIADLLPNKELISAPKKYELQSTINSAYQLLSQINHCTNNYHPTYFDMIVLKIKICYNLVSELMALLNDTTMITNISFFPKIKRELHLLSEALKTNYTQYFVALRKQFIYDMEFRLKTKPSTNRSLLFQSAPIAKISPPNSSPQRKKSIGFEGMDSNIEKSTTSSTTYKSKSLNSQSVTISVNIGRNRSNTMSNVFLDGAKERPPIPTTTFPRRRSILIPKKNNDSSSSPTHSNNNDNAMIYQPLWLNDTNDDTQGDNSDRNEIQTHHDNINNCNDDNEKQNRVNMCNDINSKLEIENDSNSDNIEENHQNISTKPKESTNHSDKGSIKPNTSFDISNGNEEIINNCNNNAQISEMITNNNSTLENNEIDNSEEDSDETMSLISEIEQLESEIDLLTKNLSDYDSSYSLSDDDMKSTNTENDDLIISDDDDEEEEEDTQNKNDEFETILKDNNKIEEDAVIEEKNDPERSHSTDPQIEEYQKLSNSFITDSSNKSPLMKSKSEEHSFVKCKPLTKSFQIHENNEAKILLLYNQFRDTLQQILSRTYYYSELICNSVSINIFHSPTPPLSLLDKAKEYLNNPHEDPLLSFLSPLSDNHLNFFEPPSDLIADIDNIWEEKGENRVEYSKGKITRGTLNALVLHLTSPDFQDIDFMKTFITTYRSFTSPTIFLRKLKMRYRVPESHSDQKLGIQLRICNILKQWIEMQPMDFCDESFAAEVMKFAQEIKETPSYHVYISSFLSSVEKVKRRGTMKENIAELRSLNLEPHVSVSPSNIIFQFSEEELAKHFTLIDFRFFQSIRPEEFLYQSWSKQKFKYRAKNLINFIQRFNELTTWTTSVLLFQDTHSSRARAMTKLVRIAEYLHKFNNFHGLMAIIIGCKNSAVHRLKETRSLVPQSTYQTLTNFSNFYSSNKSYVTYRQHLRSVDPPCVPFIATFLSDLTFIEDGNPDFVKGLINYRKKELLVNVIREIQQFQQIKYDFPINEEIVYSFFSLPTLQEGDSYSLSLSITPRN